MQDRATRPSRARRGRTPPPATAVHLGNGSALRAGDHAAFLYRKPSELLTLVVPYLLEGVRANDRVVYVADDLDVREVHRALEEAGLDVAAETKRGRLTLSTSTESFFAGGRFDVDAAIEGVRALIDDSLRQGYRRVRFSVEMTYLLRDVPGIERGVEFEGRVNDEVFRDRPIVCICSFNEKRDDGRVLLEVLKSHQVLIQGGAISRNPHYVRWTEGRGRPPR